MSSGENGTSAANTLSGFLRRNDAKRTNPKRHKTNAVYNASTNSTSSNHLQRHEPNNSIATSITSDSSVVFDEEATTAAAASVAITGSQQLPGRGDSPQPSQLSLTQNSSSLLMSSQPVYLPRQRPRFHTVQDLDVALNQAIEGKINSKNAWVSKEASDLLEGITHTIESTLENNSNSDEYSGFAKAATVVEGCSKVWTIRVDSTYNQSNQMVQRLLRNDENDKSNRHGDGGGENNGNEEPIIDSNNSSTNNNTASELEMEEQRQRSRSHAKMKTLARTLAMEASEINLDAKAKAALTQAGIKPQFRAITEKFDQGNAQGLLMYNAPIGNAGNYILDVDYSRVHRIFSARQSKREERSRIHSHRNSGAAQPQTEINHNTTQTQHLQQITDYNSITTTTTTTTNQININSADIFDRVDDEELQRRSEVSVQYDNAAFAFVKNNNLPEYNILSLITNKDELFLVPSTRALASHAEWNPLVNSNNSIAASLLSSSTVGVERHIKSVHSTNNDSGNEEPAIFARSSTAVVEEVSLNNVQSNININNNNNNNNNNNGENNNDNIENDDSTQNNNNIVVNTSDYNDDGDNNSDGGYWPESYDDNDAEIANEEHSSLRNRGSNSHNNISASSNVNQSYFTEEQHNEILLVNEQAHQLVSGVAELTTMDALFPSSSMQLALEADDPTEWCPLSEDRRYNQPSHHTTGKENAIMTDHNTNNNINTSSSSNNNNNTISYGYDSHFSNVLLRWAPHSELGKLHKEHHFLSQKSMLNANRENSLLTNGNEDAMNIKGIKRTRKDKTVVFDLPDDISSVAQSQRLESSVFTLSKDEVKNSSLKQATTMTKNVTAFGKEVLLGNDAPHNILRYTQGAFQRQKAESNGLLQPPAPIPGETIPSYTFYPLSTNNFFQPFSTSQSNWNLLRKSAAGSLIESSTRRGFGAQLIAKQNQSKNNHYNNLTRIGAERIDNDNDDYEVGNMEDMPVEFFPAGAERLSSKQLFNEMDVMNEMNGIVATGGNNEELLNANNNEEEQEYDMGGLGEDFYDAVDNYTEDVLRAEEQLLSQFDALHNSNMEAAQQTRFSSVARDGSTSVNNSVAAEGALTNFVHSQRNSLLAFQPRTSTAHIANTEDLINVLKAAEVTIPNQVDVVRLRLTMWEVLRRLLTCKTPKLLSINANELTNAHHTTNSTEHKAMLLAEVSQKSNINESLPPKRMMKRHVLAAMARRQRQEKEEKQRLHEQEKEHQRKLESKEKDNDKESNNSTSRNDDKDDKQKRENELDEEEKEEEEEELSMLQLFKNTQKKQKTHSHKRHRRANEEKESDNEENNDKYSINEFKKSRLDDGKPATSNANKSESTTFLDNTSEDDDDDDDNDDEEDEEERSEVGCKNTNTSRSSTRAVDNLPTFSHVVQLMLPTIASISSSGTLSPAFFFFSILFLANEYNVILESVPALDDLIVKGVVAGTNHEEVWPQVCEN